MAQYLGLQSMINRGGLNKKTSPIAPAITKPKNTVGTPYGTPRKTSPTTPTTPAPSPTPTETKGGSLEPEITPYLKVNPNLFGLPYQFPDIVDPRIAEVSVDFGTNFAKNIVLNAPICTIIPGVPTYLPGKSNSIQQSTAYALLSSGESSPFADVLSRGIGGTDPKKDVRIYDFQQAYTEYIQYVNVLCRAGAVYLGLDKEYITTSDGTTYAFTNFDWKKYKWNANASKSFTSRLVTGGFTALKSFLGISGGTTGRVSTAFTMHTDDNGGGEFGNYNYVQFYVDADVGSSESLSNSVGQSQIAQLFDSGSTMMKEIAFMANSGGLSEKTRNYLTSAGGVLANGVNQIFTGTSSIGNVLQRVINLGGEILKGNNIVIPDIYQSSSYQKSYSLTVHLKSPYGTKLGYYMDVFVPLMHLMALAIPKQGSANSYESPFLVKAHVEGIFSCNLGIVDSISISRSPESWNMDGLPTEVDVTLNISDLYSALFMSPSSAPVRFVNNSSLIEFLAVNCGLSITTPNLKKKWNVFASSIINRLTDIPGTIASAVDETINAFFTKLLSVY